jgi:TolA-binding protein
VVLLFWSACFGFSTDIGATSSEFLERSQEALDEGDLETAVRSLLNEVQDQRETMQKLETRISEQEGSIRQQQEVIEQFGRQISEQEAIIAEQEETIRKQEAALTEGVTTRPQVMEVVEDIEAIERLYRRAEETRTIAIFDVPRRDKERYFRRSIELFHRLAETYPESRRAPDALYRAAKISRRWLKDIEAAKNEYQTVIDNWPDDPFADLARDELAELEAMGEP